MKREIVFDNVRKKNVTITPEERVRQFIIDYLIGLSYPKSLFRVEKQACNGLKCRPDVVVYDTCCNPFILVECKSSNVEITEDTIWQVMKYNRKLKAKYIVVTNGISTYCWKLSGGTYVSSNVPQFS